MVLLCIAMVVSLAGCGSKKEEKRDTLNIAVSGDNATLLPCEVIGSFVGIVRQYSETLLDYTADGELVWGLATGVENDDTLEWTFKLREGVKFSNGNDFTAEDVKFIVD